MSVVPLLLFCSLLLVAGSIVLFVVAARQGDCHEADRMCLLPLEDDAGAPASPAPPPAPEPLDQDLEPTRPSENPR
ncbi:MAG: cytochrome oxidase [Planctomycetota bacterium]